eukprot:TRINITY_DN74699_c0_g1_i1.p1 TRINITY_DN74699_c0_g1~~TRINITY_DN74699_c0_g1_i1.p1  ORF type:complete len:608 (+),score=74.93 TRINITY_DN74699_c0_g1_i1:92-1825(+)
MVASEDQPPELTEEQTRQAHKIVDYGKNFQFWQVLEELEDHPALVDAQPGTPVKRWSVLHQACICLRWVVDDKVKDQAVFFVKQLMRFPADPYKKNRRGQSAFDVLRGQCDFKPYYQLELQDFSDWKDRLESLLRERDPYFQLDESIIMEVEGRRNSHFMPDWIHGQLELRCMEEDTQGHRRLAAQEDFPLTIKIFDENAFQTALKDCTLCQSGYDIGHTIRRTKLLDRNGQNIELSDHGYPVIDRSAAPPLPWRLRIQGIEDDALEPQSKRMLEVLDVCTSDNPSRARVLADAILVACATGKLDETGRDHLRRLWQRLDRGGSLMSNVAKKLEDALNQTRQKFLNRSGWHCLEYLSTFIIWPMVISEDDVEQLLWDVNPREYEWACQTPEGRSCRNIKLDVAKLIGMAIPFAGNSIEAWRLSAAARRPRRSQGEALVPQEQGSAPSDGCRCPSRDSVRLFLTQGGVFIFSYVARAGMLWWMLVILYRYLHRIGELGELLGLIFFIVILPLWLLVNKAAKSYESAMLPRIPLLLVQKRRRMIEGMRLEIGVDIETWHPKQLPRTLSRRDLAEGQVMD